MANGFTDPGDVNYSFRPDPKTGEEIRQGTFRYSVKAKDENHRFNHNITGNYLNNLKEGAWSYKINQKDFTLQQKGVYTTGTVSMEAFYQKGLPNGSWRFESVLKNRTGEKVQDKWVWGKYDSAQTIIVAINFSQGIITGPFYAKSGNTYEVKGSFDQSGFFDGEWNWTFPDSTISLWYEKGVLMKMNVVDPEGNLLHQEDHSLTSGLIRDMTRALEAGGDKVMKDYSFKPDTLSMLQNPEYHLTRLLSSTLYQPHYFLYMQIGGDKSFYYDKQTYKMQYKLTGMYHVRIRSNLSGMAVQTYSRMESVIGRMESQLAYIYSMKRDGKLKQQSADAVRLMEYNVTLARKYACTGEALKLYLDVGQGIESSDKGCSYLSTKMEELPTFKSRDEALLYFAEKISMLEKENQKHYTNIRKNMVI